MSDQKRLPELALKGLETERQRIDQEITDIQKQIRLGKGAQVQTRSTTPARTGSRLTPAGRKKLSDSMKHRWPVKKKSGVAKATK